MRQEHTTRLRQLREAQSLSQADLAERAGLSAAAIIRLEHGQRKPWPRTARKLAEALGVPVEELYGPPARRTRPGRPAARWTAGTGDTQ